MEDKAKLLKIFHKFGCKLEDDAIKFKRMSFKPKTTAYSKLTVLNFLRSITEQQNIYSMYDSEYYLTSIENWKTIAKEDLLNLQKYMQPTLDCDKYARMFQAKSSITYGLNSCSMATAKCIDEKSGGLIAHAFNLIITVEEGVFHAYVYEPQTDCFKEYKKGDTILDNPQWNYGNLSWVSL